jgi:hypothetical protein
VIGFAFLDEPYESPHGIFDGYIWVDTPALIKVEFFSPAQLLVDQVDTPPEFFGTGIWK